MAANSLWKSTRLTYRGIDANTDDHFFSHVFADAEGFLNACPQIPAPRNTTTTKGAFDYYSGSAFLVAAVICLPVPESESKQRFDESTGAYLPLKTGRPIGIIALKGDDPPLVHHRKAVIEILLLPEYQGKGYGTESLHWILEWGFQHANLHRIGIGAFSWNEGACRLYQRVGFKLEGRMRDFFWHDGAYRDLCEFAMLEDEWRELSKKAHEGREVVESVEK